MRRKAIPVIEHNKPKAAVHGANADGPIDRRRRRRIPVIDFNRVFCNVRVFGLDTVCTFEILYMA
jgi:hypothetical protein